MSNIDTNRRDAEELDLGIRFTRALREGGFEDFFVLDRKTAQRVLTDERLRLLDAIDKHSDRIESKSDLAEMVGRDDSAVHRDLDILFENGLIQYEKVGNRRIPELAYKHILVEPIR